MSKPANTIQKSPAGKPAGLLFFCPPDCLCLNASLREAGRRGFCFLALKIGKSARFLAVPALRNF